MLARDAYDEFAKAPYSDVIDLKPHMDREKILAWIKATDTVPASRRRLYLTMLGVCGQKADAELLEEYMRSGQSRGQVGSRCDGGLLSDLVGIRGDGDSEGIVSG